MRGAFVKSLALCALFAQINLTRAQMMDGDEEPYVPRDIDDEGFHSQAIQDSERVDADYAAGGERNIDYEDLDEIEREEFDRFAAENEIYHEREGEGDFENDMGVSEVEEYAESVNYDKLDHA